MAPEVRIEGGRRPATLYEEEWEAIAEKLEFDSLGNVRAAAEKWTGALATMIGIFSVAAIVKGPSDVAKLDLGWTIVVAAATGAAIASALWATYLGARAAYGFPEKFRFVGTEVRRLYRTQTEKSARDLAGAIHWVMRAIGLLAIALGVLWFATPKDTAVAASMLVVQSNGQVVCGALQSPPDGRTVRIKPTGGDEAMDIRASKIRSVTSVPTCPAK
jgi:hypothetical protein